MTDEQMSTWASRMEVFIRPSDLGPMSLCPGKPLIQAMARERFGEAKAEPATTQGTNLHAVMAECLGRRSRHCEGLPLARYDRYLVTQALTFVWQLIDYHHIEYDNIMIEHHIPGAAVGIPNGGTADVILVIPFEKIFIIDWKFVFNEIDEAPDHAQVAGYAAAGAELFAVDDVEVVLFCPRLTGTNKCTRAGFDAQALRETAAWSKDVTARCREQLTAVANEMPIETAAGFDQCQHCRALTICKTARKFMNDQISIAEVMDPTTDLEWGDMADAVALAVKFHDIGKEQIKRHLIAGGSVSRWKLSPGREITKIDPVMAIDLASKAGELPALLEHATFKADASSITCIADAVTVSTSAPSLRPDRASK